MGNGTFQIAAQFVLCIVVTVLFARKLPRRDEFSLRAGIALMLALVFYTAAIMAGYTLYPTLTDDRSFLFAVCMFALVIAALTGGVCALWDAPVWTALFCASSGYLVQSIVIGLDRILHIAGIVNPGFSEGGVVPIADVLSLGSCAIVTLVALFFTFARDLRRDGLLGIHNPVMFFAVLITMTVVLVLDLAIKDIMVYEVPHRYRMVLSVVYPAICIFILVAEFEVIYNQQLRESTALMEHTVAEQQRQFELSRETISAVNRRIHDIRHHVAGILDEGGSNKDQLKQVLREVDVYDSAVRTGNAALDVVLTEKSLVCRTRGITLSCIADGNAVAHLPAPELYALFGNALDYALGASRRLGDAERRSISLNVREQLGMALIGLEFFVDDGLRLVDGLPADGGLTFEALRSVVGRHDGTLTCTVTNDVMHMDILLPVE